MDFCIVEFKNINVLYIDSSLRRRKALGDLFLASFHFLFITSDYNDINRIYGENANKIDLIVIDMDYDIEEKIQILKNIKKQNRFISIILLCDVVSQNNLVKLVNLGVTKIILSKTELVEVVEDLYDSFIEINARHELNNISSLYEDTNTGLENSDKLLKDIDSNNDYAVIIINVDKFRRINEHYGYDAGDSVAKQIVERLKYFVPNNDIFKIYKMQVDEYAILIRNRIEMMDFQSFATALYEEMSEKEYYYNGTPIYITSSIGVAVNTDTHENLLQNANLAIEHAKKFEEKFVIYNSELKTFSEDSFKMVSILKYAINNDKIHVYYQPIVNNNTLDIEKYEALVRIEDEEGNIHLPITFLEISKHVKLYPYITKKVIEKAFAKFSDLPYKVSINLSVTDMTSNDIKQFIITQINKYPSIKGNLVFEILETESISDYDTVSNFLAEMQSYGCQICIDDFGTGYSNFSNILKLRVNTIKIDGSLIHNIVTDRSSQVLAKAIISFAKELGMNIVAEFVSDVNIYEYVKQLGVDYSQGYYFGKPLPENMIK